MKLPFKICLINIGIAIIFAALACLSERGLRDFPGWYGMIALWGGALELIVGLVLLISEDKRWAQGLLLSAGLLVLTGFLSCSLML